VYLFESSSLNIWYQLSNDIAEGYILHLRSISLLN
jgi:hypothetical protein